jgi:hypothetical protein
LSAKPKRINLEEMDKILKAIRDHRERYVMVISKPICDGGWRRRDSRRWGGGVL